jgi:pimeloyl-ACP methyl ester carboxylesterase
VRVPVTNEISLRVHDLGGDGPALLLCHATGFHGRVWRPLASHLADTWHSWAPDLRGHGDSAVPPGTEMHWDRFADDVLAVVDALGGGPLAAVGHSKGGAARR